MGLIRFFLLVAALLAVVDGIIYFFIPRLRNQYELARAVKRLVDVPLNPIRKMLGKNMPFDLSYLIFVVVIVLIVVLW